LFTLKELSGKGLTVPLWPDAGEAIGAGRTTTYRMAKDGTFPVPVLRIGKSYRVATANLVTLLGGSNEKQKATA